MQNIDLKKFGTILVSRPAGLEAFNAVRNTLNPREPVKINFDGVLTVTPSWFDEFLTRLADYMQGAVELKPTSNASVLAAFPVLGKARNDEVAKIINRAIDQMADTSSG